MAPLRMIGSDILPEFVDDPCESAPLFELNGYSFLKWIGSGAQSSVYRVRGERFNRVFAAKVLHSPQPGLEGNPEFEAMRRLNHPGIIRCYDAFHDDEGRMVLVYEYCQGGSLQSFIDAHDGGLPVPTFKTIARQIVEALAFMHGRGWAHGDIKPANILFVDSEHRRARVADFGLALWRETSPRDGGSPLFQSPELWLDEKCDPCANDVWALGVTFCLMLTGAFPWRGATQVDRMRRILVCDWSLECDDAEVVEAIRAMLTFERTRATVFDLAAMPLFAGATEPNRRSPSPMPARVGGGFSHSKDCIFKHHVSPRPQVVRLEPLI